MKLDLEQVVTERNRLINSFSVPTEHTSLTLTEEDLADHQHWLREVYRKTLLYEACVFDDCARRLEKEFRWN